MAFMGIFILIMLLGILALLALAYLAMLIYSAVATVASGVCWGIMKKLNVRHRDVPLSLFISYGIILGVLLLIILSGKLTLDGYADKLNDQYMMQYIDLGVYAEESADEIKETDCITLDGVKYYQPHSDSPLFYRGHDLDEEHLTPVANVFDDTHMIYDVKNNAGVRILWYDSHQFLTHEDAEIAEEYYKDLAEPQKMAISKSSPNYGYEDVSFETELFNSLYSEFHSIKNFENEEVQVMGSSEQFYIIAFSPDNVAIRDVMICYKDNEVYYYKYHNKYRISDKEAHDALLEIAKEYYE